MSFLDPVFLAGLGVAGVPILIHLIHRRRARRHRFAAMEFLLRSHRRTARRWRIRQLLLLAVRTLAIAAIPLALSRPFWRVRGPGAAAVAPGGPSSVVVVVDDSMSMGWQAGGARPIDEAAAAARGLVESLAEEDNAALVFAGAPARTAVADLTFDREVVIAALDQATVGHRATDLAGALSLAWGILQGSALPNRRVVVLTDGQAAGFDPAKLPWRLGEGPVVDLRDVTEGRARPNVAVVGVKAASAPEAGAGAWRFDVSVAASGTAPAAASDGPPAEREVPVTLEIDGAAVARGFVNARPGDVVVKTLTARVGGEGVRRGRVVLTSGDGLQADDVREFSLRVRPTLRILVVNGDPRTVPYTDEVFYLEKALLPAAGVGSRLRPTVIQAAGLAAVELAAYDVVFLANVGEAPPGAAGAIEGWVRQGGGLIVAAGDRMASEEGRWAGPLLPSPWRGVRRLGGDSGEPAVRLGPPPPGMALFALFRGQDGEGLRAALFHRYLLVDAPRAADGPAPDAGGGPDAQTSARSTLLTYADGAPALLERTLGEGRVLLLTTTVDRDWSDLAVSTGFLPLMQELCHHAAQSVARAEARTVAAGGRAAIPVPPAARSVRHDGPGGEAGPGRGRSGVLAGPAEDLAGREEFVFEAPDGPDAVGVHTLAFLDAGGVLVAEEDVVVTPPPEESDLTPLPPEIAAVVGSGPMPPVAAATGSAAGEAPPPPERRANLWPWALLLLVGLLCAETALLWRRRAPAPSVPSP